MSEFSHFGLMIILFEFQNETEDSNCNQNNKHEVIRKKKLFFQSQGRQTKSKGKSPSIIDSLDFVKSR